MPEAMSEKRGLKGLQEWGKKVTEGYRDVNVENLTSSWRDGLAFCAIIHHFRPDLLDFDSLSKENALENNSLAFSVAEKQLGVPALLDANDMVNCIQPDRLSIATYLSQLYRHFEGGANKKYGYSNALLKRPIGIKSLGGEPPHKVTGIDSAVLSGRKYEFCQSCKHRVFILERLVIDGKLYHRTCFKCYRCSALLKPGAYNEGETPGLYECTVCPHDEETELKSSTKVHTSTDAVKDSAMQNDPEQIANETSNDTSKFEENMTISKSFQQARMCFLQNDLDTSDQLKTKCEPHEPNNRITNFKPVSASHLTSTSKSHHHTSGSETSELPCEVIGKLPQQQTPSKMVLAKPPVAKKPDLAVLKYTRSKDYSKLLDRAGGDTGTSHMRKNSLEINDQTTNANVEKSTNSLQEGYQGIYNRQKLKPLKIELPGSIDLNVNADNSSPSSTRTPQLDLPVIKSTNYQTPLLTKNLTRTKSESNFQQTQKMSLLSEALNSLPKRYESADDLEKVFHSKWSKQLNYLSPTIKKDFSVLKSSESMKGKDDSNEISSGLSNSEDIHTNAAGEDKTDATIKESPNDSFCENVSIETKVENEETSFSEEVKLERSSEDNDTSSSKRKTVEILEELSVDDSDKILKQNSLDFSQERDLSCLTDTHSTCTVTTEESENHEEYPDDLNPFGDDESEEEADGQNENYPDSLNPFESSDDEDLTSFSKASTLPVSSSHDLEKDEYDRSLNPFSSDEDDEVSTSDVHSSSKSLTSLTVSSGYSNSFSFISSESPTGTKKKKKAPPPPPTMKEIFEKPEKRNRSHSGSLRASPKASQKRAAPKPPVVQNGMVSDKPQKESDNMNILKSSQSETSSHKQWRKKKRPAPSVPVPPRRQIKMIPLKEIQSEMAQIEVKQQELENQGRELELLIRDCNQDSEPSLEEEEAIMQLFELVNQKNILFRRQAELMYIKRSQRLEEEQVELEFQIRCLMAKPAHKKSEEDNQREEELLQRLLDVVEQRDEIVNSIEMDRKSREIQEDQSIQEQTEQKFIEIKEKWSGTIPRKKKDKHKHKKDKKKNNAIKEESEATGKSHKQKKKKSWF